MITGFAAQIGPFWPQGLHAVTGHYWVAAAWLADEAGQPDAEQYLERALVNATISRDRMLHAHISHIMAARAERAGAWLRAAALVEPIRVSGHLRVACVLHAALALAHRGGVGQARLMLAEAGDRLRQAADVGQRPPAWLTGLGQSTVDIYGAWAAQAVGSYELTADHA